MSHQREADLLIDLAKLLRKYGPEPFEALAYSLADPAKLQQLSALVSGTARAGRAAPLKQNTRKAKDGTGSARDLLESVRASDPLKYEILAAFRDGFFDGTLLPTLQSVRDFVAGWHLSDVRLDSRQKAFSPLLRGLVEMPIEQLQSKLRSLTQTDSDRDLAGWSRLILDRERRPKS